MKIAICGKGGSGKSTLTALLANELSRTYKVLVIDSDESNSGLYRALGFDSPPVPLMDMLGGKTSLRQKLAQSGIFDESRIAVADVAEPYLLERNGLKLIAVGKILQSLEGCACPMGVLSREFLRKLMLQPDELVIVDMEAGVEHFGRGVDTSIDSVIIVVEPPMESLNVALKIHELASGIGAKNIWAIMNKVTTEEIAARLKEKLEKSRIDVIGCIYYDTDIFSSSLDGNIPDTGVACRAIKEIVRSILNRVDTI